jgi:hypothetical protein
MDLRLRPVAVRRWQQRGGGAEAGGVAAEGLAILNLAFYS